MAIITAVFLSIYNFGTAILSKLYFGGDETHDDQKEEYEII